MLKGSTERPAITQNETKNLEKVITMARQIVTMKRDNAEWERDVLSDSEKKVLQEYLINYNQRITENKREDIEGLDIQIAQLVALIREDYKGDLTNQLLKKAVEYEKAAINFKNSIAVLPPEMKQQIEILLNNNSDMSKEIADSGEYLSDTGTSMKK